MSPLQVPRVVYDTNSVVSALVFRRGRLGWLRSHWSEERCVPLVSRATAAELIRVLSYTKFRLTARERSELYAFYLPYCEIVAITEFCALNCRDVKDQMFLDLAQSGRADVLVSGDQDLLILAGQATFAIETPASYWQRIYGAGEPPT